GPMTVRRPFLHIPAALVVALFMRTASVHVHARPAEAVALAGTVSSADEGKMEGVVVSARRDGASFTVSVVSDARGQYAFPRTHLEPGTYAVSIRAVGYELSAPSTASVDANRTQKLDLSLHKTKDVLPQLTSLEIAMSLPGDEAAVDRFVHQRLSCAYCHTYN